MTEPVTGEIVTPDYDDAPLYLHDLLVCLRCGLIVVREDDLDLDGHCADGCEERLGASE